MKMGYKTQSILSMPIKDNEGEVIGVAQAVNKVVNRNLSFNEHDEKVTFFYFVVLADFQGFISIYKLKLHGFKQCLNNS